MAMQFGRGRPLAEINVTPMVDVVLVLLIIFMVAAPMIQQGVAVDLPRAAAEPLEGKNNEAVLTMTRDKKIFLGEVEIPRAHLLARLRGNLKLLHDGQVFLHADHGLDYGTVVEVMTVLQASGIKTIGMVTDPSATPPTTKNRSD